MRRLTPLLVLLLGTGMAAQTQPEGLQIFPGTGVDGGSFITRLSFNGGAGEALTEYPASHFEGFGDRSQSGASNNPQCAIAEVVLFYQDQDRTTQHNFGMVMRPQIANGPGPDNNNTIFQFTNIQSPPNPGGTGPVLWWNSFQFINQQQQPTPIALPTCQKTLFFGMSFNANSNWPNTDGLSVVTAYYDPINNQAASGDNVAPRQNVPNLTWEISNNAVTQPTIGQVIDYVLISPHPMLQVGARHKPNQSNHSTDDGFGVAALYPIVNGGVSGREDGALIRITDNRYATTGGSFLLFVAVSTNSQLTIPPIQLGGLIGSVYIGPIGQFPLGGGPLSTASAHTQILLAPPASIPANTTAKVYFQAAVLGQGKTVAEITNMAGVHY